jgi:enoyl-CoA hydratase/carnithine racemase
LLLDTIGSVTKDESIRAIIVTGYGRDFCAGADIKERVTMDPDQRFLQSRKIAACAEALASSRVPTIAAIEGFALGAGLEVALACDIRIVAADARLGFPEVAIGVIPAAGGTQRLTAAIGPAHAKHLILLAKAIDGTMAGKIGLATVVVESGNALSYAADLAATIARNPPGAVRRAKAALDLAMPSASAAGLEYEAEAARELLASADYQEGITAFLEKREPHFTDN